MSYAVEALCHGQEGFGEEEKCDRQEIESPRVCRRWTRNGRGEGSVFGF